MKVGLIGAGSIASLHAKAYHKLGVVIAAVTDIDRGAFEAKRDLFGHAVFHETPAQLVTDSSVEIVDICVNNRFHAEMVHLAAEAGKHIFCEKTLTDSEQNSRLLVELLSEYRPNFQVGYMKRFFPATQKAQEVLPEIGRPLSAYVRSHQGYEQEKDPYDDPAWQPQGDEPSRIRRFASGGMLNMAGSHMLDLVGLFLGEPASVYSLNWMPKAYDAETNSHALFKMRSGCIAHFEAALSPYSRDGLWRDGWDERFEINGTDGKLEIVYPMWNLPGQNEAVLRHYSQKGKVHHEYAFPRIDPFESELAYFTHCCREGRKSIPGIGEGYLVDKIIDACYHSAGTGEVVKFKE
jgi:predicted dehydrogenase